MFRSDRIERPLPHSTVPNERRGDTVHEPMIRFAAGGNPARAFILRPGNSPRGKMLSFYFRLNAQRNTNAPPPE